MSALIQNSGARGPDLSGLNAGARPQLQSRRVTLKLGPFGLTYATDQVLWSDAALDAAANASDAASDGASDAASDFAAQTAAQAAADALAGNGPAQDAAWTEPARPRLSFQQEMLEAWSNQAQARSEGVDTYGPDGTLRESAEDVAPESTATGASAGAAAKTGARAREDRAPPGAGRMRRAIAAYLSCAGASAGACAGARPMLCAVA